MDKVNALISKAQTLAAANPIAAIVVSFVAGAIIF